jgi:hypothetical protein
VKKIIVQFPEALELTPQELDEIKLQREINAMARGEIAPRSIGCALCDPEGVDCGHRTPRRMGT